MFNEFLKKAVEMTDKIDPEVRKKLINSGLDMASSYLSPTQPDETEPSLATENIMENALLPATTTEPEKPEVKEAGIFSTISSYLPSKDTIKQVAGEFLDHDKNSTSEFIKEKGFQTLKQILINNAPGIMDKIPEDVLIKTTEQIINYVSPIEANIKESITRKSVVIDEKALNDYLQNNFKDNKEVSNIKLTILGQNIFEIEAEIEKLKVKSQLKQKILLTDFKINKEEGYAKMKVLGDINLQGERWVDKIVLSLIKFIFKALFKEKFMSYLEENQVKVDGNVLLVDLKDRALKKYYESPLSDVLDENISFLGSNLLIQGVSYITGTKTLMDIMEVKGVTSEIGKLIVDVAFKVPE